MFEASSIKLKKKKGKKINLPCVFVKESLATSLISHRVKSHAIYQNRENQNKVFRIVNLPTMHAQTKLKDMPE